MKSKRNNKTVIRISKLFITVFLLHSLALAQSLDKTKLNIVHEKISMIGLLEDIEEQTGFYFSFSPDDFKDRFLKVRFIDRSLSYILEQIFEDQFAYLKNGAEIIVFKNRTPEEGDTPEIADGASPDPVAGEENIQAPREIVRIDTVYKVLRDTLFLKDTVYITDTILVRDTIYKQKVVKNAHSNNISFKNTLIDDNRPAFYLDAYYAPVIGSTVYGGSNQELGSIYSGAFEDGVSYAAGLNGGVVKNGFIAETGLSIRKVRNKLNYTFNKPEESFYEVDTLDSYYTVADSDTTWFFVTDSLLQVIPGYNEFYHNTNEYTFLDIPFNLGYQLNINRFDLELRAGISLGFLLSKQGYYIADEELYPVKNLDDLESKVAVNGGLSFTGVYHLSKRFGFSGQLNMRTAFSDPFRDSHPVERDRSEFLFRVGIRAKL